MEKLNNYAKLIAADALRAVGKCSMVAIKAAIRSSLVDVPALTPVFADVFPQTRVREFTSILAHIRQYGSYTPPAKERSVKERLALPTDDAFIKEVRARYYYDPETGELVWRPGFKGKRPGSTAGQLNNVGTRHMSVCGTRYTATTICWILHYGKMPDGKVRMKRGTTSMAIKNLYVLR